MMKNVGNVDRVVRFVLGAVLIFFAFFGDVSVLGSILMIIGGVVLLFTAYNQCCMAYKMMGINTCHCCTDHNECVMEEKKEVKAVMKKSAPAKVKKAVSKKKKKKK